MQQLKYIITAIFIICSTEIFSQIIKDRGTIGSGIMAPVAPAHKPIAPESKPIQKAIEHTDVPPLDENKYSLSNGRKEVRDSTDDRVYQIDAVPERRDESSAKKYFGTIEIISVEVKNGETIIKVIIPVNFSKWLLVSKQTVVIDRDTQKRYYITGMKESVGMANTFALNLTRYPEKFITLTFPPLDERVQIIDLVLPIPSKYDIEQLD